MSLNFSSGFLFSPIEVRQQFLFDGFQFKCACEACKADYPLVQDLKRFDQQFQQPLSAVDTKEAIKIFQTNCEYVARNVDKYPFPSFEICCVMQNSYQQLQFIAAQPFILESIKAE